MMLQRRPRSFFDIIFVGAAQVLALLLATLFGIFSVLSYYANTTALQAANTANQVALLSMCWQSNSDSPACQEIEKVYGAEKAIAQIFSVTVPPGTTATTEITSTLDGTTVTAIVTVLPPMPIVTTFIFPPEVSSSTDETGSPGVSSVIIPANGPSSQPQPQPTAAVPLSGSILTAAVTTAVGPSGPSPIVSTVTKSNPQSSRLLSSARTQPANTVGTHLASTAETQPANTFATQLTNSVQTQQGSSPSYQGSSAVVIGTFTRIFSSTIGLSVSPDTQTELIPPASITSEQAETSNLPTASTLLTTDESPAPTFAKSTAAQTSVPSETLSPTVIEVTSVEIVTLPPSEPSTAATGPFTSASSAPGSPIPVTTITTDTFIISTESAPTGLSPITIPIIVSTDIPETIPIIVPTDSLGTVPIVILPTTVSFVPSTAETTPVGPITVPENTFPGIPETIYTLPTTVVDRTTVDVPVTLPIVTPPGSPENPSSAPATIAEPTTVAGPTTVETTPPGGAITPPPSNQSAEPSTGVPETGSISLFEGSDPASSESGVPTAFSSPSPPPGAFTSVFTVISVEPTAGAGAAGATVAFVTTAVFTRPSSPSSPPSPPGASSAPVPSAPQPGSPGQGTAGAGSGAETVLRTYTSDLGSTTIVGVETDIVTPSPTVVAEPTGFLVPASSTVITLADGERSTLTFFSTSSGFVSVTSLVAHTSKLGAAATDGGSDGGGPTASAAPSSLPTLSSSPESARPAPHGLSDVQKLALGVGLGLGIPAAILAGFSIWITWRRLQQEQAEIDAAAAGGPLLQNPPVSMTSRAAV